MISKTELSQKVDIIKGNEKFWAMTTFFLTMIFKVVFNLQSVNINLIKDEIGYLALPVTLAGLNWSSVIQQSSYYGFGYIVLFTPLFKWIDNPYVIWCMIRLINILGLSAVSVGLFYLQKTVFKRKDSFLNCMVAVFICYFASITWDQEYSIFVSAWVAVCMFWSAYNASGKKKIYMSILLAFWLCYSMTLHERNIVLAITVIIMILFYALVFRDSVVSLLAFLLSFVLFYNVEQHIKQSVLDTLYTAVQNGESVANTSVFTGNMLWFLEDLSGAIQAMGSVVVANIYTLVNRTYGIAMLAFVLFIYYLVSLFNKENRKKEKTEKNPELFFLMFSFLSTAIIIAGLAVKWGHGVYVGDYYSYKALVYFRYFGVYIWPAVFSFLLSKENKTKSIYAISAISYVGIYLCMNMSILESLLYAIGKSYSEINVNNAWVDCFRNISDPYIAAKLSLACVIIVGILLLTLEQKRVLAFAIACLMVNAIWHAEIPQFTSYTVEGTYGVYAKIGDELPDIIFVDPMSYDLWYTMQYMLLDTELILYKPGSDTEFVYFTRNKDPQITAEGVRRLDLNVYEHLYVLGEELQESFTAAGYEFVPTFEEECCWLLDKVNLADDVKVIVDAGSKVQDVLTQSGYNVSIENMFEAGDETKVVFSKYLVAGVDALYSLGYYVREMGDGFVLTNDVNLFIEIENAYLN